MHHVTYLIPGQNENNEDYQGLILRSTIEPTTNFSKSVTEYKRIRNNRMDDLCIVANTRHEINTLIEQDNKLNNVKQKQKTHSHLLYL